MPFLLNGSILALLFIVRRKMWKKKLRYFLVDALKKKKRWKFDITCLLKFTVIPNSVMICFDVGCSIHFGSLQYGCYFRDRRSRQMAVYQRSYKLWSLWVCSMKGKVYFWRFTERQFSLRPLNIQSNYYIQSRREHSVAFCKCLDPV